MISTIVTQFSCAHFYFQPLWSPEKNRQIFGKCFSEHGHGHDYKLEVSFSGSSSTFSKNISDLTELLDHQHLNFKIPEFKNQVPTTENLALFCYKRLDSKSIHRLRLYERPDLWVEINS